MTAFPLHPTIYLDFDGVCHPAGQSVSLTGKLPHSPDLFVYAPILDELLDGYPAVEIVLTTRWSWVVGCKRAASYLPPGLACRVVASVHPHKFGRKAVLQPQIEAILRHVRLTGRQRWVAIDDDPGVRLAPQDVSEHFVVCDSVRGLSDVSVQEKLRTRLSEMCEGVGDEARSVTSSEYRLEENPCPQRYRK